MALSRTVADRPPPQIVSRSISSVGERHFNFGRITPASSMKQRKVRKGLANARGCGKESGDKAVDPSGS